MNTKQWLREYKDTLIGVSHSMAGLSYKEAEILGNTASQIVTNQMQADAQRKESELAYKRSLPTNQVNNLVNAGMSRAGAINTLNGGGSYTPAPISASAPSPGTDVHNSKQLDAQQAEDLTASLNSFAGNMVNLGQMKHQEKLLKQQIDAQKDAQQRELAFEREKLELERDKFDDSAGHNAALRNLWQQDTEIKKVEQKLLELRYDIESATKDNRISAENKENIARASRAILDDLNAQMLKVGYDNMSPEVIRTLMELRAQLEIVGNVGEMSASKVIELFHNIKNLIANWL